MSEHPKQLELQGLYIELFGSHNVSELTLDLLEIWFNDLCEQFVFPPDKRGKWTYLLPSYNGIECLSYFETEDEASNSAFYFFKGQHPRVVFTGQIHNTFNI